MTESRADAVARARAAQVAEIAERRKRVLKYPDLAQRLTERPLSYQRPEQWNGFVPPRTGPPGGLGQQPNDSPVRAALVEICAEAKRRDDAAQQPANDTDWSTTE